MGGTSSSWAARRMTDASAARRRRQVGGRREGGGGGQDRPGDLDGMRVRERESPPTVPASPSSSSSVHIPRFRCCRRPPLPEPSSAQRGATLLPWRLSEEEEGMDACFLLLLLRAATTVAAAAAAAAASYVSLCLAFLCVGSTKLPKGGGGGAVATPGDASSCCPSYMRGGLLGEPPSLLLTPTGSSSFLLVYKRALSLLPLLYPLGDYWNDRTFGATTADTRAENGSM